MIKKTFVIDRRQFKQDYVGYLDRYRKHLYTLFLAKYSYTTYLGDYDDSDPAWSPDGKHIAFVSNRTEDPDANSNTDIWVVDANNPNKDKKLCNHKPM
jgi:dipeptidyl aminopeptidase/acylaminoacyl peptidase